MAGDPGRFEHRPVRVTAAEQRPVGHHQVHLHRLQLTDLPPGQHPQRGVRRDRTHPPTLRPSSAHWPLTTARERAWTAAYAPTTSLSGPSTLRYAIPSGAGRTVTRRLLHRRLHPPNDRGGVQLGRDPARGRTGLLDPQPAQQRPDPGIHHAPVRHGQGRGGLDHRHRHPLTAHPSTQGGHGVRHLVHQRPGQPHEPVPQARRLPPRQRHHRPHRPAPHPAASTTSREQRSASVARACAADAAPLTRSSSPTRSTRSRSDNDPTSTPESHPRNPATVATAPPSVTPPAGSDCAPAPPSRDDTTASPGPRTASATPSQPHCGATEPGSTTRPLSLPPSMT